MSWWPFKKKPKPEAKEEETADDHRQHFREALDEAFLRGDDLQQAIEKMKQERQRRAEEAQSLRPNHLKPETTNG